VEVTKKGNNLVITIPINQNPEPSATGKTLSIASSRGNKETSVEIDGKKVIVGLNAYVYATPKK
jgi:hypothetical protein